MSAYANPFIFIYIIFLLWEGDKIFFRLLDEKQEFFSLKLVYNGHDTLESAALNGKAMELLDVLNEDGTKTGMVRESGVAPVFIGCKCISGFLLHFPQETFLRALIRLKMSA